MNRNSPVSRRSFLKTLGTVAATAPFVTRNLLAQSPNRVLRHASFGAAGMAWSDLTAIAACPGVEVVAVCDVDLNRMGQARERFPNARFYQDWRELLAREGRNLDTVNVSTPDHMHAPIAMSAMQRGLQIYGEKPLAHDIHETRRLTEFARERKLITQMGIQVQSSAKNRSAVQLIHDGVIGKVKEVHSWCGKSWGDPSPKPDRTDPVPEGLDWDLWLGVAEERPFMGERYYHPGQWRKRLDFGTGTFGDMGCHILDPVFLALELGPALSVRSEGPAPNAWNWALDSEIHYRFAGTHRTALDTLDLTWYDGAARPPAAVTELIEGDPLPPTGSAFLGTEGLLLLPHTGWPQLYPETRFEGLVRPELEPVNHWEQFIKACRGEGRTTAQFDYAGPLTEAVLLGGVASRFPHTTLKWNTSKLTFDVQEADAFVRRIYRAGWEVKGLT